jgi:hypothetical protein
MTTLSMSSASAPIFLRMLESLAAWLDKAELHAEAKKFDADVLLAARLAPDMLPFAAQVRIACDAAKFGLSRLAGAEAPKFADDERTLAELKERVRRTIGYLQSVPPQSIDGSEERDVSVPRRDGPQVMKGEAYLKHVALPNFFFHVTTAYALLRHNGVELGKNDYLGLAK